jgi:cysteinyl-tRNA synthetase
VRLFFSNTARAGELEEFQPLDPPRVGLYTCGPTVYGPTHVGHVRTYVNSDVLRRVLGYAGYDVRHVMNVTDVGHMTSDADAGEDKLEVAARREARSPWDIARFYEEHFFRTMAAVNVERAHVVCRATEHVDDMIALIQRLEARGFTYRTSVGVIFDTARFPDYARFARLDLEGQQAGARVEADPERRQPSDFALWVTNQPTHLMKWPSPWGEGFPGWHIECSAMSMCYLGETLDLHTGGVDHVPVHHTNEIAQSEAATGRPFARVWLHSAFLLVDGLKMSKSLGNLFTLEDVVARGFAPLALRYLFLSGLYRKEMNFTWAALAAAQAGLTRLWQRVAELPPPAGEPLRPALDGFEAAIASDLNTARALAALWDLVRADAPPAQVAATVRAMDRVFGLDLDRAAERLRELAALPSGGGREQADALAAERERLRRERRFAEADGLRAEIRALGFLVEDTPAGPQLRPLPGVAG